MKHLQLLRTLSVVHTLSLSRCSKTLCNSSFFSKNPNRHYPHPAKMADSLDQALDDIIRNKQRLRSQTTGGPSRGRGRSSGGPGPTRRFPNRDSPRAVPYDPRPPMPMPMLPPIWEQRMLIDEGAGSERGVKLYISNLDYGVSNHDLMLLFSDVGDLKRYAIHCDKSGRSKKLFSRKMDAVAAIRRFNNVKLDGKPMHIEIVGQHLITSAPVPPIRNSILAQPQCVPASGLRFNAGGPLDRGGGHGVPWGRVRVKASQRPPSAEDLDADLERYRLEGLRLK